MSCIGTAGHIDHGKASGYEGTPNTFAEENRPDYYQGFVLYVQRDSTVYRLTM
jgi:translation elongation factor EF-Tu-like GTPase